MTCSYCGRTGPPHTFKTIPVVSSPVRYTVVCAHTWACTGRAVRELIRNWRHE